jgi:hypothetical protein
MNTSRRSRGATVAALFLTLALAGPTLGATATQSTSETLTVSPTISLTGLPATVAYGTGVAGDTRTSIMFDLNASTNNAAGLRLTWTTTNLTDGGSTIPFSQRHLLVTSASGCSLISPFTTPYPQPYGVTAGVDRPVCESAAPGAAGLSGVQLWVVIPPDAEPGAYTGTTTFKAIDK